MDGSLGDLSKFLQARIHGLISFFCYLGHIPFDLSQEEEWLNKISTRSLTRQVHFVFLKTCNAMQSASKATTRVDFRESSVKTIFHVFKSVNLLQTSLEKCIIIFYKCLKLTYAYAVCKR